MNNHKDKDKDKESIPKPIEKHTTAAWANIENIEEISNVAIPSETEVENAKDWVETNQK